VTGVRRALRALVLSAALSIGACVPASTVPTPTFAAPTLAAPTSPAPAPPTAARPAACAETQVPPPASAVTSEPPGPLPAIPADVEPPAFWMGVCAGFGGSGYEDDYSYDGSGRARVDVRFRSIPGQSAGSFMVYDGSRLLIYDAASNSYFYPNLAPGVSAFSLIGDVSWVAFRKQGRCGDPLVTGRDRILGWDVVRVRCGTAEVWVAPEIGLILRTVDGPRRLEAARVELRPTLPADYFSGTPPPGAQAR
jgi:hypothetical protein